MGNYFVRKCFMESFIVGCFYEDFMWIALFRNFLGCLMVAFKDMMFHEKGFLGCYFICNVFFEIFLNTHTGFKTIMLFSNYGQQRRIHSQTRSSSSWLLWLIQKGRKKRVPRHRNLVPQAKETERKYRKRRAKRRKVGTVEEKERHYLVLERTPQH